MAWDCRRDIEKRRKMGCYSVDHKNSSVNRSFPTVVNFSPGTEGLPAAQARGRAEPIKAERPQAGARDSLSSRSGPLFTKRAEVVKAGTLPLQLHHRIPSAVLPLYADIVISLRAFL